jgi:hypothetical protein
MEAAWDANTWPGWHDGMVLAAAEQQREQCVAMVMRLIERYGNTNDANTLAARWPAVRCAAKLKAPQAAALLDKELKALDDAGHNLKWVDSEEVLSLLADIASPEAFAMLNSYARADASKNFTETVFLQLVRLKQPSAWDAFVESDESMSYYCPNVRTTIEAMKLSGDLPAACDLIAKRMATDAVLGPVWREYRASMFGHPYLPGQSILAQALDTAGDPRGAELLGKMLSPSWPIPYGDSRRSREIRAAISALSRMKSPAVGPALRGLLKDSRRSMRCYVAEALGRRRDKEALPLLRGMLKHPDAWLQYTAKTAIRRIEAQGT